MKTVILKSALAAVVLALVLMSPHAYAQTTEMRFSVPFAFTAVDRHLPAGDYVVRWDSNFGILTLERKDVESFMLPVGIAATPTASPITGQSKLLFNQYGDRYFLHAVERGGVAKREWTPSKAERETAKAADRREVAVLFR